MYVETEGKTNVVLRRK